MKTGDVVRMTHWTHHDPSMQLTFRAGKKEVAVFLLLGIEARDGSSPLDLERAINDLGWFREALTKGQDR